ncbi:MAG: cytochrome-c peroxidase [Halieaceae bacterium]|jgi:parallel beta-helix repeat protein|nr:cytochrome-c peroxidase [Halieaceae bacterium]
MSIGRVLTVIVVLVAFAGGMFIGKGSGTKEPVMTDSGAGVSYLAPSAKDTDGEDSVVLKVEELVSSGSTTNVAGSSSDYAVIVVEDGQSIQEAVKNAAPRTTIRVMPGTYHETVYIDKDNIRLVGVIKESRRAVLDGQDVLNDAILYSGNNIVVEGFLITKYKGNGIMGQAGNNFEIRNNIIVDTGVYGIFPQLGQNGVVELNVISGIEDAAIYVGMSDNIQVAYNEVFDSVAGIEIENSRHSIVEGNYVYNNTGGILAFITPGLPIKTTYDVIVRNNWISGNNTRNFGAPGSTVGGIPAGTGIMVMAADDVVIENNIITNNKTIGIMVVDHGTASELTNVTVDPESDPNSDGLKILDNLMYNNGYDTIDPIKAIMLTELKTGNPDILRMGPSKDSCIINRHRYVTVGIDDFAECGFTHTKKIGNYLLPPVAPRKRSNADERGKVAYLSICAGCHTYTGRMIGPPVQIIQALYANNPQGIVDYMTKPVKKREDYPEMPPQDYLDEETRMAVAKHMLSRTN